MSEHPNEQHKPNYETGADFWRNTAAKHGRNEALVIPVQIMTDSQPLVTVTFSECDQLRGIEKMPLYLATRHSLKRMKSTWLILQHRDASGIHI